MNDKHLYLSERTYGKETEVRLDKVNYNKWCRILGGNKINSLLQLDENICKHLGHKDYVGRIRTTGYNFAETEVNNHIMKKFEEENAEILFASLYQEWARRGLYTFKTAVDKLNICSEQIHLDYLKLLFKKMGMVSTRVLIQDLHCRKEEGCLKGNDSAEEYQYYVNELLGKRQYRKELYEKYPVLMRCMTDTVEMTTRNMIQLIECFYKDKEKIENCFFHGNESGGIRSIQGDMSDSHKGGQTVLDLTLRSGERIIYKPHSVENEMIFQEWIHLFSRALNMSCYVPQIIAGDGYGWEEYVEYQPCKEEGEVSRYYYRLGIYLFIAHLLQANDLHFENLIVHGEFPVLVDLEALAGPRRRITDQPVDEIIKMMLQESVLNIGILPSYHWNASNDGIDISAMNNQEKQVMPIKIPIVKEAFTSDIYIDYRYGELENTKNIVMYQNSKIDAGNYVNDVVEGFSDAYEYARLHKNDIRDMTDKMGNLMSRYLLADTQKYSMALNSSYHPMLMTDGADRELYFYILWNESEENQRDRMMILRSEIEDLIRGDIPSFEIHLKNRNLYWHNQIIVRDYLEECPMDGILRKIESLCDKDRMQQISFIEVSMTAGSHTNRSSRSNEWKKSSGYNSKAKVDEAIEVLVQKMLETAIIDKHNHVNWINYIISSDNYNRWQMEPCGMYFYDGLSGITLLFHLLVKHCKKTKECEEMCHMLDEQLFEYTRTVEQGERSTQSMNSGLYNGEASIVWTYLMLYRLVGNEKYLSYAERHGKVLYKIAIEDPANDILDGKAGAILGLIDLYVECGDEYYLTWAKEVEKRLSVSAVVTNAEMAWNSEDYSHPLLGMAHGNAGISIAYGKLFEYTGIEEYCSKLEKILRYEHNRYDEKAKDWYDYRYEERVRDIGKEPAAWCHGAGGILSARLELKQIELPDVIEDMIETDIKRAVNKVKDTYIRESLCLCHGTCGNLLILSKYLKRYKDVHILDACKEGIEYVANEIVLGKEVSMIKEYGIGIMTGYAGLAVYLLKSRQGMLHEDYYGLAAII